MSRGCSNSNEETSLGWAAVWVAQSVEPREQGVTTELEQKLAKIRKNGMIRSVRWTCMVDVLNFCNVACKKVKAILLQAGTGPEGSRKLRSPDFIKVVGLISPTHRPPLRPGKYSWYSFLLEAQSTPGP
jgi:hypothetical protein